MLVVFGTRPEAIKMCPLVKAFEKHNDLFDCRVCVTAQHREMLDQVLKLFRIVPDYDLNLMKPDQNLAQITGSVISGVQNVLSELYPDFVFVQGDTTTAFGSALAAYYGKIPVGHVEAGLRTGNIYSPWPEEINRRLISPIASIHFAPTSKSRQNLLNEGINEDSIVVTGNTVIDALFWVVGRLKSDHSFNSRVTSRLSEAFRDTSFDLSSITDKRRRLVLITGHRRENFGQGFREICEALRRIATDDEQVDLVYPVHLNPNVQTPVHKILDGVPNVHLIQPLEYESFVYLMHLSTIILSDSGGIQEEAPSLGKPVLVLRDTTERPEAVAAGTVRLVGTNSAVIHEEAMKLLHRPDEYDKMARSHNPYGDGTACKQIMNRIQGDYFGTS